MSYLKSSLFYLKDINDFLDEKHNQYTSFSNYLENGLKKEPKEIMPFLERVIMNAHNYQLNKERFIADAKAAKYLRSTIKGVLIFLDILIIFFIALHFYRVITNINHKNLTANISKHKEPIDIILLIIIYVIIILSINLLFVIGIQTMSNRINDFQGRIKKTLPIEKKFKDFDNVEGVAMYYALKRIFTEPKESSKRKAIKAKFDTYVNKTDFRNITYPLIDDIETTVIRGQELQDAEAVVANARNDPNLNSKDKGVKRKAKEALQTAIDDLNDIKNQVKPIQNDWRKVCNSCAPIMKSNFEIEISFPDDKNKPTRYKSNVEAIDKLIIYSSNVSLLKELKKQGETLKSMVVNTPSTDNPLSKEDIHDIVTEEIVPLFNIKSDISEIKNARIGINTDTLKQLEPSKEVFDNIECMMSCETNDSCLVSGYNIPSKKCSLYDSNNSLVNGKILSVSNEDILYAKGDLSNINVYMNGGDLIAAHTRQTLPVPGESPCLNKCMAMSNCVRLSNVIEGVDICGGMLLSDAPISIDNIKTECGQDSNNPCYYYKENLKNISTKLEPCFILDKTKKILIKSLVVIIQKYRYEFNILENLDLIRKELTSYLGVSLYNKVADQINEILDESQTKANKLKKSLKAVPIPIYISDKAFIEDLNEKKYKDLGSLYYTIDTLDLVVNDLNDMIQVNVADNLSGEDNIFLERDRQVKLNKIIIGNISFIVLIIYIYYVLNYYQDFRRKGKPLIVNDPKNRTDDNIAATLANLVPILFKVFLPLAFILIGIVMMASWNMKVEGINTYNREILEKNGSNLVSSIRNLKKVIGDLQNTIKYSYTKYSLDTPVKDMGLSIDKEKELYNQIIVTVDLLTKCNLLTDGSDVALPFPWTDISFNILIIVLSICVIGFVFYEIDPIGKFMDIRKYNIMFKKVSDGIPMDLSELKFSDNTSETGNAIKVIALIIFFIMLILYCSKLVNSSRDYVNGLYNSKYYEQSRCAS
jgi:hypothetical protein